MGGRLMVTSLSALTLEIYYRYLPLFKSDGSSGHGGPAAKEGPKDTKEAKPVVEKK